MGDVGLLQYLIAAPLYALAFGVTALAIRAGPEFMRGWNERQRDKAAARAGDWTRLREDITRYANEAKETRAELMAEIHAINEREQECQRQLTDALHRIGELEGYNIGQGRAAQEAQLIVSADREARKPGLRRDKP